MVGTKSGLSKVMPHPVEPIYFPLGARYMNFPVTWELKRSGFNPQDVALESEVYEEYWAILYLPPDAIELFTPRSRCKAFAVYADANQDPSAPTAIIVAEGDFARILGLEFDPVASFNRWIYLQLPIYDSNEQSINLQVSPKYFVNTQITMSFW